MGLNKDTRKPVHQMLNIFIIFKDTSVFDMSISRLKSNLGRFLIVKQKLNKMIFVGSFNAYFIQHVKMKFECKLHTKFCTDIYMYQSIQNEAILLK